MEGDVLVGGRYELGELIGSGGSGSVRKARDTVLDRPVAIKRLRVGQDEVQRARLRLEARLAGALHHPGIAQVFDYGEQQVDDEVSPYLVMEYVEGTSLWQVLRDRGSLPPGEVMDLVAQLARALEAAHAAGIVHRDIKPGNILVCPDGRAVLVDFGIARAREAEPLTLTGSIVGSVDYISPEQSSGASATPLSDLYALGMVAYECLTGRKPLRRETQIATVLAHVNDEIPPLGGDVPAAIARLVMELTAKRPEDRPQSAAEVAARADALVADPWAAGMPGTETVAWRPAWESRRRVTVGPRSRLAMIAAALLVAVVVAVLFVSARPAAKHVPELRGLPIVKADRMLRDRDIPMERVAVDAPGVSWGTVLGQSPAAGARVDDDTVVRLRVATGMVEVVRARLVGSTYDEAARRLVAWGLVPRRQTTSQASGAGTVVSVGRAGRLPLGTTVDLVVAVAPDVATSGVTPTTTAPAPVRHVTKHRAPGHGKAKGEPKHGKGHGKH